MILQQQQQQIDINSQNERGKQNISINQVTLLLCLTMTTCDEQPSFTPLPQAWRDN
ncbi:hypothetical protein SAMD00019534_019590 [Acytostelium subglobosum LB1]|uniref:hypothetical protein n=1 Tax=Acytostelium subglobosum LB1 TaxID=1410327 RepID=UPI000645152B|nr:hypothetical protein SAMD00019534_019590 [Acytostelium subglobosum LB1]GAM18784.1 hypothetical protein SAMD00019534_019590 [Acytostelium subglobosum LB1]|eukprot:XP_012758004.1 hypothetical protein SAMD00019534_019590 [Acytostelium subglobosum LB1]